MEERDENVSEAHPPPPEQPGHRHFGITGTAQSGTPREITQAADTGCPYPGPFPTASPVPEGLKETPQATEQRNVAKMEALKSEPAKQAPRGKPTINFVYRIVSRAPIYTSKIWNPKGKFQEKSLRELMEELPLEGDIKGLVFTLEGPGMSVEEPIYRGEEGRFDEMKRHFNKLIRACLANCADSSSGLFLGIEIEPLRDEGTTCKEEDEVGAIDW
jgi:hypothetical protein